MKNSSQQATVTPEKNNTDYQQEVKAQVDKFCKVYHNPEDTKYLMINILLYDEAKTAFCFVPKAGCTTLKVIFFTAQGAIPKPKSSWTKQGPLQNLLQGAQDRHNLKLMKAADRKHITDSYYKFMIYRNPVDRLVSGYRDKIEKVPLFGLEHNKPQRNWLKKDAYNYKHPDLYKAWKMKGAKTKVNISFSDFIDYWIHTDGLKSDDHFMPTINLCNPCLMRYDYYGEFNNFEDSAKVFMSRIGANSSLLADYHWSVDSGKMSNMATKYYDQLSVEQKKKIIDIFARDLCFYYTLFPKEKDKHKLIMDIDYDIPCTTV